MEHEFSGWNISEIYFTMFRNGEVVGGDGNRARGFANE